MIARCTRTLRALVGSVFVFCALQATAASQLIDPNPTAIPSLELLSGDYRYVGDPQRDRAKIQKSIDAAVSSLGWLGRKIAANRLANHRELPRHIGIARASDNVSVTMGEYSAVAPIDGRERELVGPNGRDAKLSYRMTEDALIQFFVSSRPRGSPLTAVMNRGDS